MNTIKGMIEDLRRDETHIGGCTTKGELIIALESLERNDKYSKEIDHLHKYIAKLETRIVEQDSVLDELKAEIEQIASRYILSRERGGIGQVDWSDRLIKESDVMQLINKYKTKSEEQMPHPYQVKGKMQPERDCVNCVYSKDGHISFSETCHNCIWENQFIPKFMPKRIKASDIQPNDEWMKENEWDVILRQKERNKMTNYEKNKELLDMYAVVDAPWGVDADGKVFECDFCNNCIFREKGRCTQNRLNWLKEEYKEPEVDWSKVEVDTPILVRVGEEEWQERYFAGYMFGKVGVFNSGSTSENFNSILFWNQAKLAEQEEE